MIRGDQGLQRPFKLIFGILLLVVFYSLVFIELMSREGQYQNANPLAALYWVAVTITTLGYGDIVFHSQLGRFFSIFVALSGVAILWAVIMPLIITPRLEHLVRADLSSAPKKYIRPYNNFRFQSRSGDPGREVLSFADTFSDHRAL